MKLVNKGDIGVVGIVDVFEESNFHFPHRWGTACFGGFLNIKTVTVYGVFGGQNNFYDKLSYVFFFYGNMIEENGGWFEGNIVFSD